MSILSKGNHAEQKVCTHVHHAQAMSCQCSCICAADVAQGLAVCELGGSLTGGLLLLLLEPVTAALFAAALHLAAWLGGAALLRRDRAAATPPGISGLAAVIGIGGSIGSSGIGGSSGSEVEVSHALRTETEEELPQNGLNGFPQPQLPLSYGAAGPPSATGDIEQQLQGQPVPQQHQQQPEQMLLTGAAASSSPLRRPRPLSMRGCCVALLAFCTDFQVS